MWTVRAAGAALVAIFAGMILLGNFLSSGLRGSFVWLLWLGILPVHVGGLAAVLFVLRQAVPPGQRLAALGVGETNEIPNLAVGAVSCLLWLYPVVLMLTGLTVYGLGLAGYEAEGMPLIKEIFKQPSVGSLVSFAAITMIIAPVAEEVLFRCVCHDALRLAGVKGSAMLTSALFAVVHQVPEQAPGLFLLGLVLQKSRQQTGTLWAPILIHAGFNTVSVILLMTGHAYS